MTTLQGAEGKKKGTTTKKACGGATVWQNQAAEENRGYETRKNTAANRVHAEWAQR